MIVVYAMSQEVVGAEGTPSKPRVQQSLEWMHLEDDDSLANVIDALNFHNPTSVPKVSLPATSRPRANQFPMISPDRQSVAGTN